MARNSKIAESEYRGWIDEKLIAGTSYRQLAEELKEAGFDVSHNSLAVYHKKYLGGKLDKPTADQSAPNLPVLDIDSDKPIQSIIRQIYERQLQIVAHKQSEYLLGNCRYPTAEIKALKVLLDIAKYEKVKTGKDEYKWYE